MNFSQARTERMCRKGSPNTRCLGGSSQDPSRSGNRGLTGGKKKLERNKWKKKDEEFEVCIYLYYHRIIIQSNFFIEVCANSE
jgi:hypothetical protein